MQDSRATRIIEATPATVWSIIADVTAIERWHPSIATVDLLSAAPTGVGAARRCNFHDGTSVREDVIEVDEGRRVRLRLSEFSVPMKRLEVEITLAPAAGGHTEATFALHYEVKWGVVGKLMGATVMRRELGKLAGKLLAGMSQHLATGERVSQAAAAKAA